MEKREKGDVGEGKGRWEEVGKGEERRGRKGVGGGELSR